MKAIILAAGYATRLYPLTLDYPKALLEIDKKPIIEFILNNLKKTEEIEEIILVSNNKFYPLFKKWLKRYNSKNIKLINDLTDSINERLGALGDLNFAIKKNKIDSDILVVAGDNLFNFSLKDFIKEVKNKSCVGIGIYDIGSKKKAKKFGVVKMGKTGYVEEFKEKPKEPFSTLVGIGIYFIPTNKIGFISKYLNLNFSPDALGHFIEYLLEKKEKVYGYRFKGKWFDIGSKETFAEAKKYFKKRS